MTSALVLVALVLCGVACGMFLPVCFRLCQKSRLNEVTPEWLESFSTASYRAMEGLLSEEDFRFLSRQPGFDLSLHRKLRRERLKIFHQYLNRSISDFNRLHLAARAFLAEAPQDCSEVVSKLLWLKVRFSCSVMRAEYSYFLCRVGFSSVRVSGLISRLDEMSSQLNIIASGLTA